MSELTKTEVKESLKDFLPFKNVIINYFEQHIQDRPIFYNNKMPVTLTISYHAGINDIAHAQLSNNVCTDPTAAVVKAFLTKLFFISNCVRGSLIYTPQSKSWTIVGVRQYIEEIPIEYTLNIPQDVWYDELGIEINLRSKTEAIVRIMPSIKNSFKHPKLDNALIKAASESSKYIVSQFKRKKGRLMKTNRWRGLRFSIKKNDPPMFKVGARLVHDLSHEFQIQSTDF